MGYERGKRADDLILRCDKCKRGVWAVNRKYEDRSTLTLTAFAALRIAPVQVMRDGVLVDELWCTRCQARALQAADSLADL